MWLGIAFCTERSGTYSKRGMQKCCKRVNAKLYQLNVVTLGFDVLG
jgi:hypothetical protein